MVAGWNRVSSPDFAKPPNNYPTPPVNGTVVSPAIRGVFDIRWDDPSCLAANTLWNVTGVNVYRSDNGELGPYKRINQFPIGGNFYRDMTDNILITDEIIRWDFDWISRGDLANNRRFEFQTRFPIVKNDPGCVMANAPADVILTIDGAVVPVHGVFGRTGSVILINSDMVNVITEQIIPAMLPNPTSEVLITYRTNRNFVKSGLDTKVFYRLTSVALDNGALVETILDFSQPLVVTNIEPMDWIWREAVRRNNWILEQGGERAKAFIKKTSGYPCGCGRDDKTLEYSKQPDSRCRFCFGTSFLGGYEGPIEVIIAPDDAERRVSQTRSGRKLAHQYDVWTGPTPLLTQRDFILKQTNERYSIGPVRKPTNRGNILQQHFQIGYLDESDIIYKVPVDGLAELTWPESRLTIDERECILVYPLAEYGPIHPLDPCEHAPQIYPVIPSHDPKTVVGTELATPLQTQKNNIDDGREHRGRTQTWDNQNY